MVNGPSGQEHLEHRLTLYEDEARACWEFVSLALVDLGLTQQYALKVGADAYMPVYLHERQLVMINSGLRKSNFPASLWRDEPTSTELIFVFPRSKIMKYLESASSNIN